MATTSIILNEFIAVPNLDRTPDLLTGKIPGGFDIHWDVSIRGFTPRFNVEYSETESGPWCRILADGEETADNFLTGVTPKLGTQSIIRYFRLLIYKHVTTPTVSNTLVWTGDTPQYQANTPPHGVWLKYREMLRRHRLALEPRYGGQESAILRRKTYGVKCSRCSDEVLKSAQSSTCPICFGTGLEGGYHDPFLLLGQYQESPPADGTQEEKEMGVDEQEVSQIKTFAYPFVKYKDIWVAYKGSPRYLVKKVSRVEYAQWPVFQTLTVSRLPFSDPAYNIPVTHWDPVGEQMGE
jgi:hypothetical protein